MAPDTSTAAPTPAAAPPDVNAQPTAPSNPALSGLVQPGPSATNVAQTLVPQYEARAGEATQKAADIANQSTAPPPPGPHARLLSMVQGLALGLDSFGKAIATHGKEGGVEEVQQVQAAQQQQKIQAQQAREAQKNTQIQQQLMVADTNHKLGQNLLFMAKLPDEITAAHLKVAGEAQTQAITGADFQASHGGMSPDEFSKALSGAPVSGAAGSSASTFFKTNAQQQLDAATKVLGSNDPYVQQLQTVLANPNAAPKDLWNATNRVQSQLGLQEKATDAQTKKEAAAANSPVGKLSTPEALSAPGSQAAIQAKIDDPATAPADVDRLKALLPRAAMAQQNQLAFDKAKAEQQEAITNGDPKKAGALLQSGLVSPQELISSRKPEFAQAAFDEAIRLGGGTKGADGKWTGGTWSAVKAESQYEYAKNAKTQNTLNLLTTMQAPGGSIDIAKKEFDNIPGKIDEKTFNKILTGGITEFGGKSVTNFQAAMTSLADEYAQVLQGGAATETTLKQAKDLIQAAYTKNQGAGAFDVIQRDMAARQKGMVRDNPALTQMYPDPSTTRGPSAADFPRPVNVSKDAVLMQSPGGQPHWIEPVNQKAAANAGAVEIK